MHPPVKPRRYHYDQELDWLDRQPWVRAALRSLNDPDLERVGVPGLLDTDTWSLIMNNAPSLTDFREAMSKALGLMGSHVRNPRAYVFQGLARQLRELPRPASPTSAAAARRSRDHEGEPERERERERDTGRAWDRERQEAGREHGAWGGSGSRKHPEPPNHRYDDPERRVHRGPARDPDHHDYRASALVSYDQRYYAPESYRALQYSYYAPESVRDMAVGAPVPVAEERDMLDAMFTPPAVRAAELAAVPSASAPYMLVPRRGAAAAAAPAAAPSTAGPSAGPPPATPMAGDVFYWQTPQQPYPGMASTPATASLYTAPLAAEFTPAAAAAFSGTAHPTTPVPGWMVSAIPAGPPPSTPPASATGTIPAEPPSLAAFRHMGQGMCMAFVSKGDMEALDILEHWARGFTSIEDGGGPPNGIPTAAYDMGRAYAQLLLSMHQDLYIHERSRARGLLAMSAVSTPAPAFVMTAPAASAQ